MPNLKFNRAIIVVIWRVTQFILLVLISADDGSDDLWWEDENEGSDDGFSRASLLNREWQRRHEQFHTVSLLI